MAPQAQLIDLRHGDAASLARCPWSTLLRPTRAGCGVSQYQKTGFSSSVVWSLAGSVTLTLASLSVSSSFSGDGKGMTGKSITRRN